MTKIDARKAVEAAIAHLNSIRDLVTQTFENLGLEELERSEDGNTWLVTLGFDVPYPLSQLDKVLGSGITQSSQNKYKREYKVFEVMAENGEIKSMKIRAF